jgi:hypothetical protein
MNKMNLYKVMLIAFLFTYLLTGCGPSTSTPTPTEETPGEVVPRMLVAVTQKYSYGPTWTPGPSPTATSLPPATAIPTVVPTIMNEENQNNQDGVVTTKEPTSPPVVQPRATESEPECAHNSEDTRDSHGNISWQVTLAATENGCSWLIQLPKSYQRLVITKSASDGSFSYEELGEIQWALTIDNDGNIHREIILNTLPSNITANWSDIPKTDSRGLRTTDSTLQVKNSGDTVYAIFSQANSQGEFDPYQ